MTHFLFEKDRYLNKGNPSKIILPSNFECGNIKFIIKNFLECKKINLNYTKIFEEFATELLLHAKTVGVEKLLLQSSSFVNTVQKKNYPLTIISNEKSHKTKIDIEEIDGRLDCNAKVSILKKID